MNLNLYKKIIADTYPYSFYLMLYFQGEPYLHPAFFDMVKIAKQKHFYVATSTNGHYLSPENARKTIESGLDKIIISLDGTTQEVYEMYRKGGKLETVIKGIENLVAMKNNLKSKNPFIELQFLIFRFNEEQINEVKKLAKKLKVNTLKLKSSQIYNYEEKKNLLPSLNKYSRYKINRDGSVSIKNKLKNRCLRIFTTAVITWDGNVLPCCFDKDAKHRMGNMANHSMKSIYKNDTYKAFRKSVLNNRKSIAMCTNCTE